MKTYDNIPEEYAGKRLYSDESKKDMIERFKKYNLNSNAQNLDLFLKNSKTFISKVLEQLNWKKDNEYLEIIDRRISKGYGLFLKKNEEKFEEIEEEKRLEKRKMFYLEKLKKMERIEMMRQFALNDEFMRIAFCTPDDPEKLRHFTADGRSKKEVLLEKYEEKYGKYEEPLQT